MHCIVLAVLILMTTLPYCWSYETKEQYLKIGDLAIFRCTGNRDETSWYRGMEVLRDGKTIIVTDKRFTFRQDEEEQLMALSDTNVEDSNYYVCRSNIGDRQPLVAYRLAVIEPPAIRVNNGSFSGPLLEVDETGNVSMWCNVTDDPVPKISWYAYFNQIYPTEIGIYGPKLEIRNISRHCPWRFYCEMEFANYDDMILKKQMNITINYSPSVILDFGKRTSDETDLHHIRLNETENSFATNITDRISMHCYIDARPYNSSAWLFNGIPFVTHSVERGKQSLPDVPFFYDITEFHHAVGEEREHVLMVVIKFLSHTTYGEYECQTQNVLGTQSSSIRIYEP